MLALMNRTPQSVAPSPTLPGILRPIDRHSSAVVGGAMLLFGVLIFGLFLAKSRAITAVELGLDGALSRVRPTWMTDAALTIYTLFSPPGAIALTILVSLIIWAVSRNWCSALTFAVVVGASWVSSDIVKMVVQRPRPSAGALAHPYLPTPPDASFPSGHVVFAASIAIALMFLARNTARPAIVVMVGSAATILTGVAVVYLGVHYPTDVIAAIVWATGACLLTLAVWNRFGIPRIHPAPLATISR